MQNLLDILAQHPSLIKLDISDNEFSDDDLIAFADYFEGTDYGALMLCSPFNAIFVICSTRQVFGT